MLNLSWKQRNSVTCMPLAIHHLRSQEVRDRYQQSLKQCLQQSLEQCLLQHNSNTEPVISGRYPECMMICAEVAVGYAKKKQPNWFIDATNELMPLLDEKARTHQRYLQFSSQM